MLVLKLWKRQGQREIIINHNIRICLIESDRKWARIGIDAPKEIPVHREKIEKKIQEAGSE